LWEKAAIIEDDSAEGYRRSIRTAREMPREERERMVRAGKELAGHVHPSVYDRIMIDTLAGRWAPKPGG
jgi:hypothetical protein